MCLEYFKPGHGIKTCRSHTACGVDGCVSKHNPQLHGAPPFVCCTFINLGEWKVYIDTQTIVDNGSQLALIRNDIADQLNFKGPKRNLRFKTFLNYQLEK